MPGMFYTQGRIMKLQEAKQMDNYMIQSILRYVGFGVLLMAGAVNMSAIVVSELPTTTVGGHKCFYYDVKPKESIYSVSNELGVTREQIVQYNPTAADGLKPRMRLFFPVEVFHVAPGERPAVYAAAAGVTQHVVKRGDTIYGVARKYGMSTDYLVRLNPWANEGIHEGQILKITDDAPITNDAKTSQIAVAPSSEYAPSSLSEPAIFVETSSTIESNPTTDFVHTEDVVGVDACQDTLQVAVLLPFMLGEDTQSRTTQLYTEFFKGMLMAADTLRNDGLQLVNFNFLDTESSLGRVQQIMRDSVVAHADMIIAPDNSSQISAIISVADPETMILNIFAVKDENYLNHRNVVQTNIPHDAMYREAIDAFMQKFAGRLPVFLSRTGGQADKDSFVAELKLRLDSVGVAYHDVTFTDILRDEDLDGLDSDSTPIVFVPNSGSKNEFAKYVQALTNMRQGALITDNVKLWGYPEWVTFRGDSFDEICNLGATIYSRFLVDERDYNARELRDHYKRMYGVEMFDAVPTQGILGYDMAMMAVKGLRTKARTGEFPANFDGIQNSLRLDWVGAGEDTTSDVQDTNDLSQGHGGLINNLLFILEYSPGGFVESEKR